jgi:putative colanic acid biosynthesis acetyltransferase WcaF
MKNLQNLDSFRLEANFRGKSAFIVQLWWIIQSLFFSTSPQFMYSWRIFILRLFGASIGHGVLIRPSVRITYPWKLKIGDNCWIGDNVDLYNLGEILIGSNVVISQKSYICTGTHDYRKSSFDIITKSIIIEDYSWISTDVFVAPGVTVGAGAIIGARSSVYSNVLPGFVYFGNPAVQIKLRT